MSSFIAEQTGLCDAWDRDRDLERYYTRLGRLRPLEDVRHLLNWTRDNVAEVADIVRAREDGRVLELSYEELYLADRAARRAAKVESLWSRLGLSPCTPTPGSTRFLEKASFRMGGPATYGHLPNLAEIEAALGSDETGHISYAPRIESPAVDA